MSPDPFAQSSIAAIEARLQADFGIERGWIPCEHLPASERREIEYINFMNFGNAAAQLNYWGFGGELGFPEHRRALRVHGLGDQRRIRVSRISLAALGRPTSILLPHVPHWRWLMDRDDSPGTRACGYSGSGGGMIGRARSRVFS